MEKQKRVLILDFGGQYNLLIARRVRECGVYCEIVPYSATLERIRDFAPDGVIFTGGPATVFADGARRVAAAGFVFYAPAQTLMFVAAQSETHSPFEWKRMQY